MYTFAMVPPATIFGAVFGLAFIGFLLYRRSMRTGNSTRMFDMSERTDKNTTEILSDISGSEADLRNRQRSLKRDKQQLDSEFEKNTTYKND